MKIKTEGSSILIGGFEFRLVPSKRPSSKTTHYLHVYKNGKPITPPKAGAFVNLEAGTWDPLVLCDKQYVIELVHVVNTYFGSIKTIRYYAGNPEDVKTMKDLTSDLTNVIWKRS